MTTTHPPGTPTPEDWQRAFLAEARDRATWATAHLSRISVAVGLTTHEDAASSPEEVLEAVRRTREERDELRRELKVAAVTVQYLAVAADRPVPDVVATWRQLAERKP